MKRAATALLLALLLPGCEQKTETRSEQMGRIASDTEVLGEVNAAVDTFFRDAGNCEAVAAALPEANQKLKEASARLRTVAGRATLDALKARVEAAARSCPGTAAEPTPPPPGEPP